ncbi:MAG: YraN family protein [Hydrogenoanaerobacterium sp.]
MITEKRRIGNGGEDRAAEYLEDENYKIIQRNYNTGVGEIDIIAQNDKYIIFAEVKTRSEASLETPAEAVTKAKQRRIIKTTQKYLSENSCSLQPRFDVIEVITSEDAITEVNHLENAFWAGDFDG